MKLIAYLQSKFGLSRRKITSLIDNSCVFVNWNIIDSYKQEVQNSDELRVNSLELNFKWICKIEESKSDWKIILFNKPLWYVVSKADPNNKTIYEILPKELKNYYYIWRLDKNSHWLLLLTNNSNLVHQYEHPKNQIEKEYIVKIDSFLKQSDLKECIEWIQDDWDSLSMKHIEKIKGSEVWMYKITLTEGKKRHIRRIFKYLWYDVLDLQRIREGNYELWNIKIWERKVVDNIV